jgi:UDP-N-acetylmuramoyl-tripeptide--D-alanyl-D-alanine ligase
VVEHVPDGAPEALRYYVVPDTLAALGLLAVPAAAARRRVVAVAGSNGKTTTKELLRAVLSPKYRVHATTGNLNNQIGAPLTLLATPDDAEVIVAEIGTNTPGELAKLAAIVEPDAAVITGISAEHLEGLGDLHGVLREETSVLPWVPPARRGRGRRRPADAGGAARAAARRHVQVAGLARAPTTRCAAPTSSSMMRAASASAGPAATVPSSCAAGTTRATRWSRWASPAPWGVPDDDAIAGSQALQPPKMRMEFHRIGRSPSSPTATTRTRRACTPPSTCSAPCPGAAAAWPCSAACSNWGPQSAASTGKSPPPWRTRESISSWRPASSRRRSARTATRWGPV